MGYRKVKTLERIIYLFTELFHIRLVWIYGEPSSGETKYGGNNESHLS